MMGSISYEFIETIDTLNSQYNYHKLEMAEDEIILLKVCIINKKKKKNVINKHMTIIFFEIISSVKFTTTLLQCFITNI